MQWIDSTLLFIGSLTASTLSSIAGGGAGLLQFPLLIFLGLPFSIALSTHKIATVAMGLGAAISHFKSGKLNLPLMVYLILAGSLGVILGANLVIRLESDTGELMLGVLILLLGCYSRIKPTLGQNEQAIHRDILGWLLGGIMLLIIGILNGSLTAGSGLVVTLFLVRWFGFSYKQAVALTLICVGLFWNGIGAIAITHAGAIPHWPWVPILLVASFCGGWLGAFLTQRLPNHVIKRAFELLTFAVGFKLIIGVF